MKAVTVNSGTGARPALRKLQSFAQVSLSRLSLLGVDEVGARPSVSGVPFIENQGRMTIGDDLDLRSGPVRTHLVTGPKGVLRIQNRVTIGAGVAIAAESRIDIGDGAHLGDKVMLLDTDYHVAGDKDGHAAASPILIGAGAWLGEGVTVLRGSSIGHHARIEPGSVVSGPIPDGALAAGNPARVISKEKGTHGNQGPEKEADPNLLGRILKIGQQVFALGRPALPSDGPKTIPAWDSLGALRLLISLEEELSISLPPGAFAVVRDFQGLSEVVSRLREHAAPRTALP